MSAQQARIVTNPVADFLSDIAPFFAGKAVIYADVGANDGSTFEAMLNLGLSVDRAVLIEADPAVFARLQDKVSAHSRDDTFTCLNLAIADHQGVVRLGDTQDTGAMVPTLIGTLPPDGADADPNHRAKVDARRFDDLADLFPGGHVSLLRIAVDGQEMQVLRGCDTMLSASAIDVLYVEVGVPADHPHETLFRSIDDLAKSHGYQLFRIYQQIQDWVQDSPVQRRFNLAYVNPTISAPSPRAPRAPPGGVDDSPADAAQRP